MSKKHCFYSLLFLFVVVSSNIQAQNAAFKAITCPVTQNNFTLPYPFTGGLNAPQFNAVDLNQDGALDLMIFDRSSNSILTFLNNLTGGVNAYYYAPEYARTFPKLTDYVLLRDYNNDGAMDIFCAPDEPGAQEMRVFKGRFENGVLRFDPFYFTYPGCTTCKKLYIYYPDQIPGLWNNFPIAGSDYPSVDDIDGDGDLDIVAFSAGNSVYLTYLQNMSVERGFGTDSLQFIYADRCWGKFFENGLIKCRSCLSATPDACAACLTGGGVIEERDGVHPGASVLTFDHDKDGDKDVIVGNISFNCLNLLINGGTPQNAWMTAQDTTFPSENVEVDLLSFPAAYHLDINNDGEKDLLISPNSPTLHEDRNNVWWYENTNPSGSASFELQTRKLFTSNMIDLGTASHPAFADVNSDGLTDLIVGNYGYYTPAQNGNPQRFTNASLYLYLNTGTNNAPAFTLADADWLGMSQYAPNDYEFAPAFGDLDGDNDLDLLVGSNLGAFYAFFNQAGPDNPMNLVESFDVMWLTMDVGQVSMPVIFDLDQDGLMDIIVGERNGNINFYKNIGSPTEPMYNPDENAAPNIPNLGAINTQIIPNGIGFSAPQVVVINGSTLLITGAQDGQMEAYQLTGPVATAFPVVDLNWGNINAGNRSCPAFADLTGDGKLEVVLGNQRGGLQLFGTELSAFVPPVNVGSPSISDFEFQLIPNPTLDHTIIVMKGNWKQEKNWVLVDVLGRIIQKGNTNQTQITLNTRDLSAGIYYVQVEMGDAVGVKKLIKQ